MVAVKDKPDINFFEKDLKEKLKEAETVNDIIDLLTMNYCSFLNYEIFPRLVDYCHLDKEHQENLKYPVHLRAFIVKHKLSEFFEINPLLEDFTDPSKKLILKFEIDLSLCKLATIFDLKKRIADIMLLKHVSALRLLSIKDGCVECTFLIPTQVAEFIFAPGKKFSRSQVREFQELPILWLKCDKYFLDISSQKIVRSGDKDVQSSVQTSNSGKLTSYMSNTCIHVHLARPLIENRALEHNDVMLSMGEKRWQLHLCC